MKFLNYDKVLCLSAHPDDVEYGMLGSMIKFKDTEFFIVVLSRGGDFDNTTSMGRITENEIIWNKIDNVSGTFLSGSISNSKYVRDYKEDELVMEIEKYDNKMKFDCVLVPPPKDSHFEHRIVHNLAPALARKKKLGMVVYKTPSTLDTWISNLMVDVTGQFEEKVKLLKYFKSQQNQSYFGLDSILTFHLDYQCTKRGIKYVESYRVEKIYE